MNILSSELKRAVGVEYILNMLEPRTPFGAEKIRCLSPFEKTDAAGLQTELNNISGILKISEIHRELLMGISRILRNFKDIRNSVKKLSTINSVLNEVELFEIKAFLMTLEELIFQFFELKRNTLLEEISISPMSGALEMLDPEKTKRQAFFLSESYSEELREIRKAKRAIEAKISVSGSEPGLKELKAERLKITVLEEEEERRIMAVLTEGLKKYNELFRENIANLGKLDFLIAKAELAGRLDAVCPKIAENVLRLENVINPEVDGIIKSQGKDKSMTPVSIELLPGAAVLTGANMGGKSVALKTLLMNAYLFQCGFFVFAEAAVLPLFDSFSFISGDLQSVYTGLSSFGAEMLELNGILKDAETGFSLIILDEPARGTNPHEGRLIVSALVRRLNALNSISVISTHYDGAANEGNACYTVAGLKEIELGGDDAERIPPVELIAQHMDYRLVKTLKGRTAPKDALRVCRLLSLDAGLLEIIEGMYENEQN